MDNMAVALVLGSVLLPGYAFKIRSFPILISSWMTNLLALWYSMIAYADAVDLGSRWQSFWNGVMYLEYALAIVNFALTVYMAAVKLMEVREDRIRRLTMPP